jgi:hypothetical protein
MHSYSHTPLGSLSDRLYRMDFISFNYNEQRVSTFRKTTMDKFTFFLALLIKNNLG